MIDLKTGHLLISEQYTLTPQTSLAALKKQLLDVPQNTREMGTDYQWVDVKNFKIDQLYFNISFLFKNQKIEGCTFTFQSDPYENSPSWGSWSKEAEETNLIRFNNWLDQQLDGARVLEWGKVEAYYDSKTAGSAIRLSYNTSLLNRIKNL